ncbi:MAG: type IV pili twitching motility protein PilT, partial [Synechococcus sp. MOX_bin13]|nr:type IV pili twitching motility protein PilT [Synechococcus sp. MOX_bin13]
MNVAQPVSPPSFPPRPTSVRTSERSLEVQNPARRSAADGSPSLEEIVRIAHEAGHSDVHLGVGEVPRYRARGDMQGTEWPVTKADVFQGWLQ